ncbi:MAG: hypothetical protein HYR60_23135, partial [Acidobacteria bacterium]|nr:hypothetical protein [Acidobacteriota bacterium]
MPWLLLLLLASRAWAQDGFPYRDETLRYIINWPSGLSLGEGAMSARQTSGRWEFELSLDASVAGFTITDKFRSVAGEHCSKEFEKESVHGPRKTRET